MDSDDYLHRNGADMYVVSYDISNNKRRRKIAKLMENYGTRVQYSVFECRLTKPRYNELYSRLAELMEDDHEGSIRFYQLCGNCIERTVTIGVFKPEAVIEGITEKIFVV